MITLSFRLVRLQVAISPGKTSLLRKLPRLYASTNSASLTALDWARFGGKDIHPDLVAPLNRIPSGVLKLKPRVTQGAGNARASKGTHLGGYCVDISTRTLAGSTIRRIIAAFEAAGFAAALRLPGDAGPTEHIHAALRPHANAEAVWRATRTGGTSNLEKKLKTRGR